MVQYVALFNTSRDRGVSGSCWGARRSARVHERMDPSSPRNLHEICLLYTSKHLDAPNDAVPVMLVQGLAKGDKMDTVLRAATELGIAGFYPTEMSRSVVKLDAKKKDKRGSRFAQIARSAALQSGRTTIPEIGSIRTLAQMAEQFGPHDLVIVFWEEEDLESSVSAFFDSPATKSLFESLERIWIIIGPEGGMSADEVQCIEDSEATVVVLSLGPTILRTETAGVVACALVLNELRNCAAQVS